MLSFRTILISILAITFLRCSHAPKQNSYQKITVEAYQDKVYASWLAQCIGNIVGLPHENRYIDEPGPENFPYGYQGGKAEQIREVNGAFSDDDTDIEYMYLLAMEKHGPEPTLQDLTQFWKYHVRRRVWLANRAALGAMHYGYTPPVTGWKSLNPHWFQIDPQLINEIWATTSPGMVQYAAGKSAWAASIMCDSWGIEPTVFYGAMYAAAFFETDIEKLLQTGLDAIETDGKFYRTVQDMMDLYQQYPHDWKKARKLMADRYYTNEPLETQTIWNANLNGAAGILALLYGQGDFQKTLDMAIVLGFDNDNQAATMCGLLGVMHGTEGLPQNLLFPFPELGWDKPFNDIYVNVSRHDLPTVAISELTNRMALMGEKIILENGGEKITENGQEFYLIDPEPGFHAPLEFPRGPGPIIESDQLVNYSFAVVGGTGDYQWKLLEGSLPEGLAFQNGKIAGKTSSSGVYPLTVEVSDGKNSLKGSFDILARGENLAKTASGILANVEQTATALRDQFWLTVPYSLYNDNLKEVIRDGKRLGDGSTFYSVSTDTTKNTDFYGFSWDQPVEAGTVILHTGSVEEMGGWFNSLNVEYQDEDGNWVSAEAVNLSPALSARNNVFVKPHFVEYILTFKPVTTRAIRIIGEAGGIPHWKDPTVYRFTSITELGVYGEIPGLGNKR